MWEPVVIAVLLIAFVVESVALMRMEVELGRARDEARRYREDNVYLRRRCRAC